MNKPLVYTLFSLAAFAGPSLKEPGVDAGEHESATSREPITMRLVHPDRQAAAILKLFEGCTAPYPAAALAAWKRSTRDPGQLGKPLEAVISFFNPEMVQEWGVFHDTSFQLGFDPDTGLRRWRLTVPGDDGTLAALVTALRLSGGSDEPPAGNGLSPVSRLGGPLAPVATRAADGVLLASSRAELERGLLSGRSASPPRPGALAARERAGIADTASGSGLRFHIEPGQLTVPAHGTVRARRAIELVRGLGCRTITGSVGLLDDRVSLETSSDLDPAGPFTPGTRENLAIDPECLKWIPASDVVALASLTMGRGAGFWDALFSMADRIDRADPARANLAPLRTRMNLLATAVRAPLETDLWPHLQCVTVAWLASLDRPAQAGRAVAVLEMDDEHAATHLVAEVLPRLATLLGKTRGRVKGQPVETAARGRMVLIGWGDRTIETMLQTAEHPERSVKPLMEAISNGAVAEAPARLGAYWPGRMQLAVKGLDGPTPLIRALAQAPPIVWRGWTRDGKACDRVCWQDLHGLVRRFLETIPLQPPTAP